MKAEEIKKLMEECDRYVLVCDKNGLITIISKPEFLNIVEGVGLLECGKTIVVSNASHAPHPPFVGINSKEQQ